MVLCSHCRHANPDGAQFCNGCGAKLEEACPACGTVNPPGSRFCNACGAPLTQQPAGSSPQPHAPSSQAPLSYTPRHLAERIRAEQVALAARGAPDGERKTITALFADIKGSMDLLEDLDPEDARRIVDPALKLMMEAVHRYEGYVAQSLGDGIFALFGAPIAHEDHPQRALYAALRMQEEIRRYAETLRREHGVNLEIRVGVNTGVVVVRAIRTDDLHTDYVPIGHSTSLAARLQSLASGGAIVVSEPTYKLTEGYFAFTPLGTAQVKGVSEPVEMYEVTGVGLLRKGNPFFMEEIVQALCEQGVLVRDPAGGPSFTPASLITSLTEMQLPPTVQGVLAARIDRLPPEEKALLQTLAVIGKEFSLSLLTRVVQQSEDELQRLLAHLRAAEFIYEQPAFPEPEYTFKHALTQEVAYNALLLERRRGLHERTGQAIEALFPSRLEEHYGVLAHHYSHSGNARQAVEYLQRAGQQAVQRSAYAEAISHLTTAVELLETLPDTVERAQRELVLQLRLGQAMAGTKGWAAPEVERAYARAQELCQQVGEPPQLFGVLNGLFIFYLTQGKHLAAHKLAEQLLSLAQRQRDPALLVIGHHRMGESLFQRGELSAARSHLEQAIALDAPQRYPSAVYSGARVSGVFARNFAAVALWLLGYPEQAMERSEEALTLVRELANPSILTFALHWATWLHQFRREGPLAQERAEAGMTLATEHGFAAWVALGTIIRGWALAEQGRGEEGIAQMRQGLATLRAAGFVVDRGYYLSLLAEAYGKVGQAAEGLSAIAEALAFAHTTGERCWEAELYRLKGELLLQSRVQGLESGVLTPDAGLQVRDAEAEACFRQALEIARRQQAKSLELRAAMSLSRLWQRKSKRAEARTLLAPIYGWFTEGFDTPDLQDAKALLDALS